ncbi:MAG: ATP-dependent DNA helicase RecG, partial [Chloroflexi bacterium]|nr:ATP-dependent DNA helicase RecG [Chloroflexota bacterium]
MTTRPDPAKQLESFRKIVAAEASDGYRDGMVTGGLYRFLENIRPNAKNHPALKALEERGLLSVGYRDLDLDQRKRWIRETERYTGEAPPPKKRPVAKPAPPPPAPVPVSIDLNSPTSALKTVNKPNAEKLAALGVHTVRDLIWFFPNRHLDYSDRRPIANVLIGEEQTVVGALWEAREVRMGRAGRLRATEAVVGDDTGNLRVVWFNQPWVAQNLRRAMASLAAAGAEKARISLSGKVTVFNGRKQMDSPEWEVVDDPETSELVNTGRLVPVYPKTEGLYQKSLRRIVREALLSQMVGGTLVIEDPLPVEIIKRHGLQPLGNAISQAHYPDSKDAFEEARRRLAFDEFLLLQLAVAAKRGRPAEADPGIPLTPMPSMVQTFISSLPFELTASQQTAIAEATEDVAKAVRPMSRLLQGDVGSGKTVVALAMLLTAVADGYQGALMAPTEVLAEQHFLSIRRLLSDLVLPSLEQDWFSVNLEPHPRSVSIGLLTGSTRAAARRELARRATDGTLDIIVGTHALIQKDVEVTNLALGVVDEQHRFGVLQRAALRGNGSRTPHLLLMSATPIPRTLALTVYGDLDASNMPELPVGRLAIKTRIIPPAKVAAAENFLVQQVQEGRQCFVVCPLIDESEAVLARAATAEFDRLRDTSLAGLRLGLLHGRMPLVEKQAVMDAFRAGAVDVLVTTTVIEVGIDVPNATVMLIQGADRFGLAQLHQLRGRVGRGEHQSYCLLTSETLSADAEERLNVLVKTNDGFEIAEADLRLRGPGDFFGTRQSGLPTLKMARIDDRDLLTAARAEAQS